MNPDVSPSLLEQAGTLLYQGEYLLYTFTGVAFLVYHASAFRALRTRALLLLVISSALGLFVLVADQTIARMPMADNADYWSFWLIREAVVYIAAIMGLYGALMFLRDYIRLAIAAKKRASANPPLPPTTPSLPIR